MEIFDQGGDETPTGCVERKTEKFKDIRKPYERAIYANHGKRPPRGGGDRKRAAKDLGWSALRRS